MGKENESFTLYCGNIPIHLFEEIFKEKANKTIENFSLALSPTDLFIPQDLLVDHWVSNQIHISCQDFVSQAIRIDQNAFRLSQNFTRRMIISMCDFSAFDFPFLKDFNLLEDLDFSFTNRLYMADWMTLPTLPNLAYLNVSYCKEMEEWVPIKNLVCRLSCIDLRFNFLGDDALSRILQSILDSQPSNQTLKELYIQRNELREIPKEIFLFKNLTQINIDFNKIQTIRYGSFFISNEVRLSISACDIHTVEKGAFQGLLFCYNFSKWNISKHKAFNYTYIINIKCFFKGYFRRHSSIDLSMNQLSRLESSIFEHVLLQINPEGSLDVGKSILW